MTGKTHIAAGLLVGVTLSTMAIQNGFPGHREQLVPLWSLPGIVAAGTLGGLFPDIDWHTSKVGSAVKPLSRVINMVFGHRTFFHSPVFYLLCYAGLIHNFPELYWLIIPFVAGAASHLFLDMLNRKGISLFYPYSKRYHLLCLESKGVAEGVIRIFLFTMVALSCIALSIQIFLRF